MHSHVPRAIGVIMDGNRRWAKAHGLPSSAGHRRGFEKVRELMEWAAGAGIEEVTVYAFSTENWNRAPEEVAALLALFAEAFDVGLAPLIEQGCRIRFIGDRTRFSEELQERMRAAEDRSRQGARGTLAIALSYGGRAEILAAANQLLAEGKRIASEDAFRDAMWSAGLLDPDLIIRTGGEFRLSNFLPWQAAYSELFFLEERWPEFSKEAFDAVLDAYAARDRRHGR